MVISVNGFVITNWWLHSMYKKINNNNNNRWQIRKIVVQSSAQHHSNEFVHFFSPWARDFCLLVAIIKNIWRINWENIFSMKFFVSDFFHHLLMNFFSFFFFFFSFFLFFFFLFFFDEQLKIKCKKKIDAVVVKNPKVLLWWAKKHVVLCRLVHYMFIPLHMSTLHGF